MLRCPRTTRTRRLGSVTRRRRVFSVSGTRLARLDLSSDAYRPVRLTQFVHVPQEVGVEETRDDAENETRDENEQATGPSALSRLYSDIDNADQRNVVHLINPGSLQSTPQGQIDFLLYVDLALHLPEL